MSPSAPHHAQTPGTRPGALALTGRVLLALLLGGAIGLVGTLTHRSTWGDLPAGLVLALVMTLATAVMCRAWTGIGALLAAGAGWLVVVQLLATDGPGGDVLVPADVTGYVWTYGGLLLFAVAAFLPARWFADQAPDGPE
ncbi:hypothetical protein ATJ88_1145 [Isoptericola jiangsuensis]|uniref:N-acetyl-1-D-myo-inositol-2-amino-2-deoxy-alpha-D-glucopyranoside deacetylase n=1 Tax=Isoptericola jiangsuensis TaxID=548579 RepID=A0A2A9EUR1_9MICO|nr:DUF6113 family protein [Isoptericola jiangsuensis]PFG42483.1 hypothetical protein ATJ88_1145 [Isoptericola jiangsuensis]